MSQKVEAPDVAGGVHAGRERHRLRRVVAAPGHRTRVPDRAGYYEKLARTLEEGCFDLMFFDDRLAMPGIYGGSVAEAVRTGARPVKLDLSVVLGICTAVTERIGLGATYSTTYYTPFHVARTFAIARPPLGRAGGVERGHVGQRQRGTELRPEGGHPPRRPLRPRRRIPRGDHRLVGHVGRRCAGARPRDAALRRPVQGARARATTASGSRSAGPSRCPVAPKAVPSSCRRVRRDEGREFAARWAELIFTGDPGVDIARSHYKDQKAKIGERGRDPESVKMLPMAYTVVGESKAHAEEREQLFLNDLVDPMASLTLLSELMNYDFSGLDLDAPITDELIGSVSGIRGLVQNIKAHIGTDTVTLGRPGGAPGHAPARPAVRRHRPRHRRSDGGLVRERRLRRLRHRCDAHHRAPTRTSSAWWCPSSSAAVCSADHYTGTTLREHLGLERPAAAPRA